MLTQTSATLVSLFFSLGSVSAVKTVDCAKELQPAIGSQTMEISLAQSPYSPSHRGSGRVDLKMGS